MSDVVRRQGEALDRQARLPGLQRPRRRRVGVGVDEDLLEVAALEE
jgi:hypothetical protein